MTEVSPAVRHGIYDSDGNRVTNTMLHGVGFYVEGVQYTADRVKEVLDDRAALSDRVATLNIRRIERDQAFRESIAELVEDDELDRDKANEVLEALDLDPLEIEYEGTLVIEVSFTAASAKDEDEVGDALRDMLNIEFSRWNDALKDADVTNVDYRDVEVRRA